MVPKLELPPSLHMPDLLRFRRSATVRYGLAELQKFIPFELFRDKLEELCHFSSKGRPHDDVVQTFKILIRQTLYQEMAFQLSVRLSFQRFVGIGYADDVPDARTIWKFRERLGEKGTKQLFELFFAEMKNRGLKCSQGKLVDATFQEAPRQGNTPEENKIIKETRKAPESWSEKKKVHKDIDATWTKKSDERHDGYKAHVMSDEETKIIENDETTTAGTHDSNICAELISEDAGAQTTELLADLGYFGEVVSHKVREEFVIPSIIQRRIRGQKKLTKWQEKRNKAIAKRRCGIEHIFGAIKHFGGDIVRSVGLTRCKIRNGLVFLLYNIKRFCFLSRTGQLCPDGTE